MMEIHCICGLDYDSNVYCITGKKPTIIDCGTGLHHNYILEKLNEILNLELIEQIVLTHEHYDHCGGVKKLYENTKTDTKIIAHKLAAEKIEHGESDFAKMLGGTMPKMPVDIELNENDELEIGDEKFLVLNTPGHTPGSICLYSSDSKTLFSGDTIFAYGSFGRYDFPGGNANDLKESIKRLSALDVVNLYPGHESIVEGEANKHIKKTLENVSYMI